MTALRPAAAALLALGVAATQTGCGTDVKCGPGTVLDEKTSECLPIPTTNIIVDDFKLGKFEMTNVDVPEQMEIGTPDTRSFDIKNTGTDKRDVVSIRMGIAPVQQRIEELREKLDEVGDDTELGATVIGGVVIKDLGAGESRKIEYTLNVPETVTSGLYGLFFAVDEVPLVNDPNGTVAPDFRQRGLAEGEGESRLDDAALIFAPATMIVGKPDKPNLRVLFANNQNASFELDRLEQAREALFTVSARLSAQGMSITDQVTAQFELQLPGHVVDVAGKDLGAQAFADQAAYDAAPAATTFKHDAARKFTLYAITDEGDQDKLVYDQQCQDVQDANTDTGEVVTRQVCATIFNDEGRDGVFRLHLKDADVKLLERTVELKALNPGLNADDELQGKLVVKVSMPSPEYRDNTGDNVKEFDVVFMAPPSQPAATADDGDTLGARGAKALGDRGPYPYVLRNDLTQNGFGNDWFGASYRSETNSSVNKDNEVVFASYKKVAHTFTAKLLKANVNLMSASGELDWGSDRALPYYVARGTVTVAGFKLIDASLNPSLCTTQDQVTVCTVFEAAPQDVKSKKADAKAPPKKLAKHWGKEYEQLIMAGPVPLLIKAGAGLDLGLKLVGQIIYDASGAVPLYGVQFAAGPTAAIQASVFGGVSIGIARAGVEGNIALVSLDFLPTFGVAANLQRDTTANCWKAAGTKLWFEGPITLTGPNGNVAVVAYAGFRKCFWFFCINWEVKVFSLTIASFSTWQQTWKVWSLTTGWMRQAGERGMCSNATGTGMEVWRSPTNCGGGYCGGSTTAMPWARSPGPVLAAYKKTFQATTSCTDVQVVGNTKAGYDPAVVYDQSGAPQNVVFRWYGLVFAGWSGDFDQTVRVCSPQITVTMETSPWFAGMPGITATFTPVR